MRTSRILLVPLVGAILVGTTTWIYAQQRRPGSHV